MPASFQGVKPDVFGPYEDGRQRPREVSRENSKEPFVEGPGPIVMQPVGIQHWLLQEKLMTSPWVDLDNVRGQSPQGSPHLFVLFACVRLSYSGKNLQSILVSTMQVSTFERTTRPRQEGIGMHIFLTARQQHNCRHRASDA